MELAHQDQLAPHTTLRNALLAAAATFSLAPNANSGELRATLLTNTNLLHLPAPEIANALQNSADAQMELAHQDQLAPHTTLRNALRATATTTCQVAGVCNAQHASHGRKKARRVGAPRIASVWQKHRMSTSGGLVIGVVVPKTAVRVQKLVRSPVFAPL